MCVPFETSKGWVLRICRGGVAGRRHLLKDTKVDGLCASVFFVKKVEVCGLLCLEGCVLEFCLWKVPAAG